MQPKLIKKLSVKHQAQRLPVMPGAALKKVTSKSGLGVYASADRLFKGALFGRDSLTVADDLMEIKPRLVLKILITLASLQGEELNKANEEEPGKIIHEYRAVTVDGRPLDDYSLKIFENLSSRWGGNDKVLAYYGSVDATPHFIRTVGDFRQLYGDEILAADITLRSGQRTTMLNCLERAANWLVAKLANSKSGLLEYKRLNPRGIHNQVWKDSLEFYTHDNGQLANHQRPIASIEVQALAYDALLAAADIFPASQPAFKRAAQELRAKTLELFWWGERDYFSLGLDYNRSGQPRIIKVMTANPAEMLDSRLFDSLPSIQKRKFVSAIAREVMGTEFLTDAGIRSRALSEAELVAFWDYHGSYTSWPKETYGIAKGLRRQGLPLLAEELENRLLNVVRALRAYPEFFYVDGRGRVLGMPGENRGHAYFVIVESQNQPEKIQAWTVSAIMAISSQRRMWKRSKKIVQESWQAELEAEIYSYIPHVKILRTARELAARYPDYPYILESTK